MSLAVVPPLDGPTWRRTDGNRSVVKLSEALLMATAKKTAVKKGGAKGAKKVATKSCKSCRKK
jgi:hypothetical protein